MTRLLIGITVFVATITVILLVLTPFKAQMGPLAWLLWGAELGNILIWTPMFIAYLGRDK